MIAQKSIDTGYFQASRRDNMARSYIQRVHTITLWRSRKHYKEYIIRTLPKLTENTKAKAFFNKEKVLRVKLN